MDLRYETLELDLPALLWIGVYPSDMRKYEILEESKQPLIEGANKEWRKLLKLKTREAVRLNPQLLEEVR